MASYPEGASVTLAGVAVNPGNQPVPMIRVELKGEFIYHVTFRRDNTRRVTLILESELR